MSTRIDNSQDFFDSRDIIARIEELTFQADAYIEWGGQYDHRRCELDEYKGVYEWTDWDASNELDLGKQIGECRSAEEAKSKLEQLVFQIGEPASYIRWEDNTTIRKKDYLKPGEKKFLQETGLAT